MSSPHSKLRTLRRMLRVIETERKALEWAVSELEALHPDGAQDDGPRDGCVYPSGHRCRGADRCQFPARCERTTDGA